MSNDKFMISDHKKGCVNKNIQASYSKIHVLYENPVLIFEWLFIC